jgi:hypothetical protein
MEVKPRAVNFGQLRRGAPTQHKTITLLRGDAGPIAPEVSLGRLPGLDAQVCEIEPGEHYELEVWLTPPWPEGRIRDSLEILTGVDEVPTMSISVSGMARPRLAVVPSQLNFFGERRADTVRTLTFRWDGQPGRILDTECTIAEATAIIKEEKGKQIVDVSLPPGSEPIPGTHNVVIRTDDPDVPSVTVPIAFRPSDRVLSLRGGARPMTAADRAAKPGQRRKKGLIER